MPTYPIILRGHSRNITDIKFNHDSDLLLTSARDNSFQVWYTSSGERLGSYEGHTGAVLCIDVSYNSKYVISGGGDQTAKLWDLETGKLLLSFPHVGIVKNCAFSIGADMFLTVKSSMKVSTRPSPSQVNLFALEDPLEDTELEPMRTISANDYDFIKAIWVNLNAHVLTIDDVGYVRCWDVDSEECIQKVKVSDAPLTDIKLSHDHSFVVVTSRDSRARLLRVDDLTILKTYVSDRPLNACAISPVLNHILTAGGQEATDVTLSGADEGHFEVEFWHTIYEEKLTQVTGHFGPVNSLAISRDGQMFASGGEDGNVRLYHFDEGYLNSKY